MLLFPKIGSRATVDVILYSEPFPQVSNRGRSDNCGKGTEVLGTNDVGQFQNLDPSF